MKFHDKEIDPLALWENYVEFPVNMHGDDAFLPKVQCPNPKHDTLKKHFQVNVSEPKVHCFAYCGISGSYEHAICVIEGLYDQFKVDLEVCKKAWDKKPIARSAVEKAQLDRQRKAKKAATKIILKHQRSLKISGKTRVQRANRKKLATATAIRSVDLSYDTYLPQVGLEFLEGRGITENSIAQWELGWEPDEQRIVIPGKDENGRTRFLIKRGVFGKQQPKYLYSEGFPKTKVLFGACAIDLGMVRSDGIVLVEGSIDTIMNHQNGLRNTGGILGTGISDEQVAIIAKLRPKKIFHMFDRDSAGVMNIQIASKKLRKYPQFVCRYPKGKFDPAELTESEAVRVIERAVPLFKFFNSLNVKTKEGISVG